MFISAREVAARLEPVGVTRRQARAILDAGLAGAPQRTGSATLFDERAPGDRFDRVRDRRLLTGRGRPWALLGWRGFSPRLGSVGN